jgi:hypothetical protein
MWAIAAQEVAQGKKNDGTVCALGSRNKRVHFFSKVKKMLHYQYRKINLSSSNKCHEKTAKFCNCQQKTQENAGKCSQISVDINMLIIYILCSTPEQLLINTTMIKCSFCDRIAKSVLHRTGR